MLHYTWIVLLERDKLITYVSNRQILSNAQTHTKWDIRFIHGHQQYEIVRFPYISLLVFFSFIIIIFIIMSSVIVFFFSSFLCFCRSMIHTGVCVWLTLSLQEIKKKQKSHARCVLELKNVEMIQIVMPFYSFSKNGFSSDGVFLLKFPVFADFRQIDAKQWWWWWWCWCIR